MSERLVLVALALGAFVACTGRGDTGQHPDTDVVDTEGNTGDSDTATPFTGPGFVIKGTAVDAQTGLPSVIAGLCASAVDPGPAMIGGEPEILATAPVRADGRFAIEGVETNSSIGILMLIDDCETSTDLVLSAATGIAKADYDQLGDGDVLADRTAYVVTAAYAVDIDAGLAALGDDSHLGDGALAGYVRVLDSLAPIDGATVHGNNATSYYADANDVDGLFGAAAVANTSTDAAADAFYVIPGAAIQNYTAEDGGAHTFASALAGSFPGLVVFVTWLGE
jgi:hypothetical protein